MTLTCKQGLGYVSQKTAFDSACETAYEVSLFQSWFGTVHPWGYTYSFCELLRSSVPLVACGWRGGKGGGAWVRKCLGSPSNERIQTNAVGAKQTAWNPAWCWTQLAGGDTYSSAASLISLWFLKNHSWGLLGMSWVAACREGRSARRLGLYCFSHFLCKRFCRSSPPPILSLPT